MADRHDLRWLTLTPGRQPPTAHREPPAARPGDAPTVAGASPAVGPISVIVPARDAEEHLSEQLAALSLQDPSVVFEILVVDNGSSDRTRALAAHAALQDHRIRVVDALVKRGAGYARNVGARAACGNLLAFCDADDIVAPGWAAALCSCAQATGGELIAGHTDHDALYPGGPRRWPSAIHPQRSTGRESGPEFAEGGNFALTRRAFDAVGGFDESLAFAAEDVDLSWRLRAIGVELTWCPAAVVFCRDRTTLAAALRQAYRYGRGNHRFWGRVNARSRARPWFALVRLLLATPRALWTERSRATWARQLAFWLGYLTDAAICATGACPAAGNHRHGHQLARRGHAQV